MSGNNFSNILCEAVDEALAVLGESVKRAIVYHLENTFDFKMEETPQRLSDFTHALEELLGPGASYVENMIIDQLQTKANHEKMSFKEDVNFDERLREVAKFFAKPQ
jgi:hypothetical protein